MVGRSGSSTVSIAISASKAALSRDSKLALGAALLHHHCLAALGICTHADPALLAASDYAGSGRTFALLLHNKRDLVADGRRGESRCAKGGI